MITFLRDVKRFFDTQNGCIFVHQGPNESDVGHLAFRPPGEGLQAMYTTWINRIIFGFQLSLFSRSSRTIKHKGHNELS